MAKAKKAYLFVGTQKGAFIFSSSRLPGKPSFLHVHRQGMAHDQLDPFGLFVGASNGQIFWSRDAGSSWRLLAEHLPPIFSLNCAVA